MKRILTFSPLILFILYILLPLCYLASLPFGYSFHLYNFNATIITTAIVSVLATVFLFLSKVSLDKTNKVFCALLPLASAINGIAYTSYISSFSIISTLVCLACSFVLMVRFIKRYAVIVAITFISAVLITFWMMLSFIVFLFEDFGSSEITQTLKSPQGTYLAEVGINNQGALGGSTFVHVKDPRVFSILVGEFYKPCVSLFTGGWGEYPAVEWKDDRTLLINEEEYNADG